MPTRPRKSSRHVALMLLGAAVVAGCGQDEATLRRDIYASRDDCVADWGDELKCEQGRGAPYSGVHGGYWYGPTYRFGQFGTSPHADPLNSAARPGSRAIASFASSHISRGGFGATGAAHGFGGG